ncbi:FtsX-like permease family protein [Hymenobacter sp. UV11]|uniref:ABC transporter permease n=1 Tax=Hymenobacter sp. UV11 TaxID=1849735 RepID=UPI00105B4CFC|nr:ABC transporter permease [Hymenobacter sp. UV11]TDN39419.1 ABC transporter [Hymenobacter sp. UV11]TFZ65493.1 FtsX-like permease family protein [Hymenobacter sp. UV11]
MSYLENIREALRSISGNLLRTILTALIVSIGLMALVGILTAIDAMRSSLGDTFASLGANAFEIKAKGYGNRFRRGGVQGKQYPALSYLQATLYKKELARREPAAVVGVSASITGAAEIKANGQKTNPNMQVIAGDENYLRIQSYTLTQGRTFSPAELNTGAHVAIIGSEMKDKLFPQITPVGQYIYALGQRFQVVGLLEKSGSTMGGSGADRLLLVPLETGNQLPRQGALTYDVKTATSNAAGLAFLQSQATGVMRAVRHDRLGQEDSFDIESPDSLSGTLDSLSGKMRLAGGSIAFLALLGASIALMNIMLVSVTERTREIGIRKALGATARQIRLQFLLEAIVICVLGGTFGILLGIGAGNAVAVLAGSKSFLVPWVWVGVGLTICISVGLLAGSYPAGKAAALDPIDSLRYE